MFAVFMSWKRWARVPVFLVNQFFIFNQKINELSCFRCIFFPKKNKPSIVDAITTLFEDMKKNIRN